MATAIEIVKCAMRTMQHVKDCHGAMLLPENEQNSIKIIKALGDHISDEDAAYILNGVRELLQKEGTECTQG